MKRYFDKLAKLIFDVQFGDLEASKQNVLKSIADEETIVSDVNNEHDGSG